MDFRIGLVAACMLVGAYDASAQNTPDKQEAPGKAEMPASENSTSSAKEKGGERATGNDKSESRGREQSPGRDKSAQSEQKSKGSDRPDRPTNKGSSAQNEEPKGERNKSAEKADKTDKTDKTARDERPEGKAAQSKSDSKANEKSAEESKSDTTSNKSAERDKSKSDDKGRDSSSGTSSGEAGSSTSGKVTEDKKKTDEVRRVDLSGEKRNRVQAGFRSHGDIKRVTDVNVRISVGSRAPREWTFVPVPTAVIEIVPEYRGYVFAYVGDDYVVCDPDTYEIVAVLPASGSGGSYASSGSGSSKCSSSLTLSEDDREAIIRSVELQNEVDVSGVTVGWSVPNDLELRTLPPTVIERRSELGPCRYFVTDGQVALVDPDEDRVVLLIEQK
jgi:hypothetical protein